MKTKNIDILLLLLCVSLNSIVQIQTDSITSQRQSDPM